MTPRPLYRWKSFWLGLFVACFLAWAWWDSTRFETTVQSMGRSGARGIVRVDGVTFVFDGAGNFFAYDGTIRIPAETTAKEFEELRFEHWGSRYFKIPDVVVIVSYLVLWLAFLGWRWRRMKRHAAGSVEPPGCGSV